MLIDFHNTHLSKIFYEHDCTFSGFTYDYENRTVQFCMNNCFNRIEQSFKLNNVVLFKLQSCSFWHGGNAVYDICCYQEHLFLRELEAIREENRDNIPGSFLDSETEFIVFELQINSGDILLAICESVEYDKKECV